MGNTQGISGRYQLRGVANRDGRGKGQGIKDKSGSKNDDGHHADMLTHAPSLVNIEGSNAPTQEFDLEKKNIVLCKSEVFSVGKAEKMNGEENIS